MRRRLKCTLTLVLLLGIFLSVGFTALAAGEVTVQVKDVTVSPGKTVTTELIMDGTFAAFQGFLVYDTDALILENIEATSALSGSMTMFNQDDVTHEFKDSSFVSASANNAENNGVVLTFTFRARSNADGTYSFSLEQFMVYDADGTELTVKAIDTPVDRTGNQQTTSSTKEPAQGETEDTNKEEASQEGTNKEEETTTSSSDTSEVDPNNQDSDSSGNGLIILLIVLVLVAAAGITLAVFLTKKKNNQVEDSTEDQKDQVEDED